jgi:hypothetical protein
MRRIMCVLVTASSLIALFAGHAGAGSPSGRGSEPGQLVALARFEGRWIDLSTGWGLARDCLIYAGRAPECFRTQKALEEREATLRVPDISCSAPLTLHNGTNQTGTTVYIYTRGLWINLSDVGFNNMTSSYTVGACSAELAAGSGGSGAHYSRCLNAGCVENVMASGWNNVVSSVYQH